jgi:hypothetical protein
MGKILMVYLLCSGWIIASEFTLEQGFHSPPESARPRSLWCWVNGNFSLPRITEELKDARDKGLGGMDIWDIAGWVDPNHVIPAGPPFMGDESVQAIAHAIREAKKYNLEIGLTISSSWNAGGPWIPANLGAMGLFRSEIIVSGPAQLDENLPFPAIPDRFREHIEMLLHMGPDGLPTYWKPVSVLAVPVLADSVIPDSSSIVNLSDMMDGTHHIVWQVPEGEWKIIRTVCAPTGQPLMRPSPNSNGLMIDHFSREAMDFHLRFIITKLEAELGPLDKTALKYLYTDSYEVNSAVWTPALPEEFKKRTGYDLIPWLPALDGFIIQNQEMTGRFLFDFRKVLSDLIIENHYGYGTQLCHQFGIGFKAEAGGPGPPIHNCPFEAIKALGSLDAPRGEFWHNTGHWKQLQVVKGPASAAHLYNQPVVEAEAFTSTWVWQEGPNDLKMTLDRALCEGLTRVMYHTQPHLVPQAGHPGWVYNFGTLMGPTRAWWPLSRGFNDYIARCCYLLMQGHFVGDVLFYYGDKAPNFIYGKEIHPTLGFGYDYDVCNTEIINRLEVNNSRIILPDGQTYEVLVLPQSDRMNPDVLEKIEYLVNKGLTVIGPKPVRSHSLSNWAMRDRRVQKSASRLWGNTDGKQVFESKTGSGRVVWGKTVRTVLQERGIVPDFQVLNMNEPSVIDFIHRRTETAEIYFIRNTQDTVIAADCLFRVKGKQPEFWEPETGSISYAMDFQMKQEGTLVPVKLGGYGSVFVVFQRRVPGQRAYPEKDQIGRQVLRELKGPWEIRFPFGWGVPGLVRIDQLIDWIDSENDNIRYFSGVAVYHKSFEMTGSIHKKGRLILELGQVKEIAHVYLNGYDLGIQSFYPYQFDVSGIIRTGTNDLVIEVANLMHNQLVGDALRPWNEKRTHTNITKGPNPWTTPWEELPLKSSGLMGPVRLIME